jgi:DNA-binding transcriptional regulator YhcF (GntR family)
MAAPRDGIVVSVDPALPLPVFEQLRSQIAQLIVSRQLPPGSQLPAIRHLATDLGLAKGTVAKVYEALTREGLAVTDGRNGTIVANAASKGRAKNALRDAAKAYAQAARNLGASRQDMDDALSAALHESA